jgi:protein-disulfide isomerase
LNKIAKLTICFFVIAGLGCAGWTPQKRPIAMDEAAVRQLVLDVIRENPGVVYEAVRERARQLKEEARRKDLERSFSHRTKVKVTPSDPVKGPADAPVTIVEFTDFQCPYCARGAGVMDDLFEKYPGKLRLVFKNNPLKFHKQALPAARAALAAHRQGKFWPFYDQLFDNYDNLTPELLITIAEQLGLDMQRFNRDRESDQIARQITDDRQQARAHGFSSTPTFVVNGVVVVGARRLDYFQTIIDRLLHESKQG